MPQPNRSNPTRWGKRPKGASACSLSRWQRRQLSRRATATKRQRQRHPFDTSLSLDNVFFPLLLLL